MITGWPQYRENMEFSSYAFHLFCCTHKDHKCNVILVYCGQNSFDNTIVLTNEEYLQVTKRIAEVTYAQEKSKGVPTSGI